MMTSEERLKAVFNRRTPDRVPVMSFAAAYTAKLAGVPLGDYYRNPGLAIRLQLQARDLHGYDDNPHFGWTDWGGWEFGGRIAFPASYHESAPITAENPIESPSQVDNLEIPAPETAGMMPLIHEYNRHLTAMGLPAKIQAGSVTLPVSGIIGRDRLLRWYLKEPEAVRVVYDKAAEFILRTAQKTVETYGTDCSAGFAAPLAREALESGLETYEAIQMGLAEGMAIVGRKYEAEEYFVPELLLCSDAMYAGMEILKPALGETGLESPGKIVIGVVEGDTHDIGKSLVQMMLEASGFEILDLGKDVPIERFIETAETSGARMICLSTLMSTTMEGMRELIRRLEDRGLRQKYKVVIGGGAVTHSFCNKIRADGYSPDAAKAVRLVRDLFASMDHPETTG